MEREQDYVLRTAEERGVRLIRLWFTDVLGQLKSVAISPAELENAFEEGMHCSRHIALQENMKPWSYGLRVNYGLQQRPRIAQPHHATRPIPLADVYITLMLETPELRAFT